MKDSLLRDLNFRTLISYERGAPEPQYRYEEPLRCSGFCTSCEEKGLAPTARWKLDLLSHGCDSSDYEMLIGPLPPSDRVKEIARDPNRKIEAIKVYREETGAGLAEAKEAVEAFINSK